MNRSHSIPYPGSILALVCSVILTGLLCAQEPDEFDTGRTRPAIGGIPVLGSGLAMSGGYYRGIPVGELAGWTASLWFQAKSGKQGEVFGIVFGAGSGEGVRLRYADGQLSLSGPKRKRKPGWEMVAEGISEGEWHHVAITYSQARGSTLYVDGKKVAEGTRADLGYATSFDNYHFGAAVLGKGQFGDYFDGLIDDFALYGRPFTAGEIAKVHSGEAIGEKPVAFNDFENVSHRDLAVFSASDRDEAYLSEGAKLYQLNCVACHSKDGIAPPPNPLSRQFTKHKMENGGDPLSMFETLTYGFRNMMPATQLDPVERYKVIHYLREELVKKQAPELYVDVAEDYADTMPRGAGGGGDEVARIEALAKTGYLRDYGRALIAPVVGDVTSRNGLVIDLGGETTIGYDLGSMRSIGAWTGGFLDLSNTLHHKLRAPGLPTARFDQLPGAGGWRWAWDGEAENRRPDIAPLTVFPEDQVRYRGHYPHGEEIVISYAVGGRGVLESPVAEKLAAGTVIHHRLTVEAGEQALELAVLAAGKKRPLIKGKLGRVGRNLAWLQGDGDGLVWRASKDGELVLKIPASAGPLHFNVAVTTVEIDVPAVPPGDRVVDLSRRTRGGPRRWEETHTMKGKLATSTFQGYSMDSVPVPLKNAYNSWMRTSALAFFADGRLAVSTLAGDVWIVSGIDGGLGEVSWQRFAAGLYEPLGMKVVDGVLTVGTRGRLVKLHDYNDDGEADFYEAFYNEREPSNGWHAYSFDLEVDDEGYYYYARVGGFSDWSTPGGIVRVSPDGKTSEVLGAGLRVPNGIGILPDGRVTFGDNQGTYVPASKIAITRAGAFHGAGNWDKCEGDFDPENITDPIVYMPQELDSSCGGQLWVDGDDRFGPLGGPYFHTSYGRARTMMVMLDEFGDSVQGAVFSLPLSMESGTMRVAKKQVDGQLYYSGLTGWQAGATREGSIQRLRFTGGPGLYLLQAKARMGRLELVFSEPLDERAPDGPGWAATAWNYRWGKRYGSPHYKLSEPDVEGSDPLTISGMHLTDGGRRLTVKVPDLQPCHTLKLDFKVKGKGGTELAGAVYFTIHALPE